MQNDDKKEKGSGRKTQTNADEVQQLLSTMSKSSQAKIADYYIQSLLAAQTRINKAIAAEQRGVQARNTMTTKFIGGVGFLRGFFTGRSSVKEGTASAAA